MQILIIKNLNSLKLRLQRSISTSSKLLFRNDLSKCLNKKIITDEPIKYSSSKAKNYDSYDTFVSSKVRNFPKSQPLIIMTSVIVFLIYFLVLREENDLDELIYSPLDENLKIPHPMVLESKVKEYEAYGLDTSKLKKILKDEPVK